MKLQRDVVWRVLFVVLHALLLTVSTAALLVPEIRSGVPLRVALLTLFMVAAAESFVRLVRSGRGRMTLGELYRAGPLVQGPGEVLASFSLPLSCVAVVLSL